MNEANNSHEERQIPNDFLDETTSTSEPIPITEQTETNNENPKSINEQQETENMEVHAHPHAAHGKKNWKTYFWEFLMLFLAVFCGFLAEYQLEHVIEHQREKTLMRSLTGDLKTDNAQLETYIEWRNETTRDFDSLLLLLSNPDSGQNAYFIYKLANRSVLRFGLPDISESTILQLKNAGGLRLIRNDAVSGAINKHYLNVNRMKSAYETERFLRLKLADTKSDILDAGQLINNKVQPETYRLATSEQVKINRFMNEILAAKQMNRVLINQLDSARISSNRLKQLIEKEYHFK